MQALAEPLRSPLRRRIAMALPLLGAALGCRGAGAADGGSRRVSERASQTLMGTQVDIVAEGTDALLLRHAIARAYGEMRRLEALMSRYLPTSVVSRINAAAGIVPVAVPEEVMAVLQSARQVSAASRGAFDPTVGSLRSWHFEAGAQAMPTPQELARQLPLVDASALVLDARAGTAFLTRQGMALDLGGIAKLPILDAGMRELKAQGYAHMRFAVFELKQGGFHAVVIVRDELGRDMVLGVAKPDPIPLSRTMRAMRRLVYFIDADTGQHFQPAPGGA